MATYKEIKGVTVQTFDEDPVAVGATWTELADLGTGIANGIAPAGGAVFGLASGGLTGPTAANTGTEEWTAALANKTITAS